MSDTTLKPCPFCGAPAEHKYNSGNEVWGQTFGCGCTACEVASPMYSGSSSWRVVKAEDDAAKAKALAWWNRRAALSAQAAQPVAWESTSSALIKYVSQGRYEKFTPAIQRYYKPYRCSSCAAPLAAQAAVPLSEEQIAKAVRHLYADEIAAGMGLADDIRTAREVERHHGIGSEEAA